MPDSGVYRGGRRPGRSVSDSRTWAGPAAVTFEFRSDSLGPRPWRGNEEVTRSLVSSNSGGAEPVRGACGPGGKSAVSHIHSSSLLGSFFLYIAWQCPQSLRGLYSHPWHQLRGGILITFRLVHLKDLEPILAGRMKSRLPMQAQGQVRSKWTRCSD